MDFRPFAALALAMLLPPTAAVAQGDAPADEASASEAATAEAGAEAAPPKAEPSRWAGSRLNLLNTANAWQFDRSASLTWDPYYAIGFGVAPRFRIMDGLTAGAAISVRGEITESNVTTDDNEWWFDDLALSLSSSGIALPVVGTRIAGGVRVSVPTSKASQAATLIMGVRPSISVSHRFPVLKGLSLSYGGWLRVNMHRFTTAERESPRVPSCVGAECAELIHTGVRNTRWQHGHRVGLSLGILDWLSIGTGAGVYVSHLYDGLAVEDAPDPTVEPANERYAASYDAELTVGPFRGVSAGLGLSTFNPQLAPDQSAYDPYFNRYTQAYLDLRVDIAGLLLPEEG